MAEGDRSQPVESYPDGQVPPGPAKPTPALPGEQVAFKEFETPWTLAGSGVGAAHQPLGQEITFGASSITERLLRCLVPLAGSLHRRAGLPAQAIRNSGIGFLLG